MADFNGRPVLVTGASGGIGGETVRQLVAAGADVIAGVRPAEIEAVLPMPSADVMLSLLAQMEG
jgi:NAD(P)-dependent dehydrogenase (short-subunit alcohol dehydrogenase family)